MADLIKCPEELFDIDLREKVILITGGYGGIGRETAVQLIRQGATVAIAGRNQTKGEAVASEIGATFLQVDLSDMDSVRQFATQFNGSYDRLDVLLCNAGVMAPPAPDKSPASKRTKEGWEIQMATNYLGHALLIHLLTDILSQTDASRIVSVSSCCADSMPKGGQPNQADVDLSDPHWNTRKYVPFDAYGQTKLAQILHAQELAKRLEEKGVSVVSLHPGWGASSDLDRHMPYFLRKFVVPLIGGFLGAISIKDAAQVPLYCVLSPNIESGKFYSQVGLYGNKDMQNGGLPMDFVSPNATPEKQAALWTWTMKELGIEETEATK